MFASFIPEIMEIVGTRNKFGGSYKKEHGKRWRLRSSVDDSQKSVGYMVLWDWATRLDVFEGSTKSATKQSQGSA